MKRISIYLLIIASVIFSNCKKDKDTAQSETPPIEVSEVYTDSVVIHKDYPGTLSAIQSVAIVARVDGYLRKQLFKAGDFVRQGTPLFIIESTQYQDAVAEASAQLATAKSNYEYASRHYNAMLQALKGEAVSQMEVLSAKNSLEQSEASIRQAEAALQNAKTNLSYCTVRAPFSGYMSDAQLKPGAYLDGAASPVTLATIYDNSQLNANFQIADAAYIDMFTKQEGDAKLNLSHIPLTFAEDLPHEYYADLSYIAPTIDTSTGTMLLQAKVDNPYNELKNGMYTTVSLPYRNEPKAILVKDASIGTDQKGKYLYIVNDSNKVVYMPIEVGDIVNDTLRVVESGVKPGMKYVTKAMLKVRPGMTVKPILTK